MNKKLLLIVFIILLLLISGLIFFNSQKTQNKPYIADSEKSESKKTFSPYKATFAIYTNGTFRIFSGTKYHNQSEKVYITLNNPNEIYVNSPKVTWEEFFNTLPMKLDSKCLTTGTGQIFCTNNNEKLQFFINGVNDPEILYKEIKNKDKLLVTYEKIDSPIIDSQISSLNSL